MKKQPLIIKEYPDQKYPGDVSTQFQTPIIVADYMAGMIPDNCGSILEPTPGLGNLVRAANKKGIVTAPIRFEYISIEQRFDYAIMNPPFTPMQEGYRFLNEVMKMTDNIIALLPWFIIINSQKRINTIKEFGLVSVTHLPRKTFPGCRIQCCVLEMKKGYKGKTELKTFDW